MKRIYLLATVLSLSLVLFQCRREVSYVGGPDTGANITPEPVTATLQGNVLNEMGQPAAGVSIAAGGKTAVTDARGYFRIAGAVLDKKTSLVTASMAGYFKGIRSFPATEGTNQVTIKLVKKELAGTVPAASGGTAGLANGVKISLPANGVVVAATGTAYTGQVNVYAARINPMAADFAEIIPGSLAAVDKNGKTVVLQSFGMMAVELESASGEKLQVKQGAVATITSPIATAATAPASIPLWYIDEATGLWKEEGIATKQGSNYVGDVKHFSFWNCDYPYKAVYLEMTLQNGNGKPLIYTSVKITASVPGTDSSIFAFGTTDSSGRVRGYVPANKTLVLEVLDPCRNPIYTQSIGALTTNTNLGTIVVPSVANSLVTITGTLQNCSNGKVTDGYALINIENRTWYAAAGSDGRFSLAIVKCNSGTTQATIIGVDNGKQEQSIVINFTLGSPVTDVGTITACGTSAVQFFNYNIDGTDYNFSSSQGDSITGFVGSGTSNAIYLSARRGNNQDKFIVLTFQALSAGTYPVGTISIPGVLKLIKKEPFNVVITAYPATAGAFFEGSLNGKYLTDSTSTTEHTITGNFRIRRSN